VCQAHRVCVKHTEIRIQRFNSASHLNVIDLRSHLCTIQSRNQQARDWESMASYQSWARILVKVHPCLLQRLLQLFRPHLQHCSCQWSPSAESGPTSVQFCLAMGKSWHGFITVLGKASGKSASLAAAKPVTIVSTSSRVLPVPVATNWLFSFSVCLCCFN